MTSQMVTANLQKICYLYLVLGSASLLRVNAFCEGVDFVYFNFNTYTSPQDDGANYNVSDGGIWDSTYLVADPNVNCPRWADCDYNPEYTESVDGQFKYAETDYFCGLEFKKTSSESSTATSAAFKAKFDGHIICSDGSTNPPDEMQYFATFPWISFTNDYVSDDNLEWFVYNLTVSFTDGPVWCAASTDCTIETNDGESQLICDAYDAQADGNLIARQWKLSKGTSPNTNSDNVWDGTYEDTPRAFNILLE